MGAGISDMPCLTLICPCRGTPNEKFKDYYRSDKQGYMVCSYCGSVHPDQFMVWLEDHMPPAPTKKDYKVYVDHPKFGYVKFYFAHLSHAQREDFLTLWRSQHFKLTGSGKFHVMPFFIREPRG